ncbi:hypothetical protein BayCH28_07050 [Mycolicibacterium sp. CH28]|uniref:Zn-ribbon domain-containing OB-fold protein n=1 Tax=Mycolicibacterium sp. CH28 TaxID=2512237 RepID=UPI0010815721|nr:hypothetical protein BayCH28_07050 [Mycolicibacterium sp. CH28]
MTAGVSVCERCGTADVDQQCCLACGAETRFVAEGAAGTVYSWTTVHRGMPGVAVPYTLAYADFDDGLRLFARVDSVVAVGDAVRVTADGTADVFHFAATEVNAR